MDLIKIDRSNIGLAREIQRLLFPDSDAAVNYLEAVENVSGYEYWLVEEEGEFVGISGIYSLPVDPDSAWLGWFGILPKFRRMGLGSRVIRAFEDVARERGFLYARLYTGRYDNEVAKAFYRANGYQEEFYDCPEDPGGLVEPLSIFLKALNESSCVPPWGNKSMNIDEQWKKQESSVGIDFAKISSF